MFETTATAPAGLATRLAAGFGLEPVVDARGPVDHPGTVDVPGSVVADAGVVVGLRPIDVLRAGVDELAGLDLSRLAGPELLDLVRELETQKRRLAGVDQALLAQLSLRHVAGEMRYRDTASLLVDVLRINPVEARMRVGDAADFGPSATLTGQPLPPNFPEVAAAIGAGGISVGHARAVVRFVGAVPSGVPAEVVETAQAHLMKAAEQTCPAQVAKLATALLARLDQDGPEPREDAEQRRRGFSLLTGADGWSKADGLLSPLLTASLNALFDSLGAPKPAEDGAPDDRSPAARRHDAMLDATQRLLRSNSLPDAGGAPITVLVTIDETDLRERVARATGAGAPRAGRPTTATATAAPDAATAPGAAAAGTAPPDTATAPDNVTADRAAAGDPDGAPAQRPNAAACGTTGHRSGQSDVDLFGAARTCGYGVTSHGDLLPIADVLALAAEAAIIPVVLNDAGGVVSYGRAQRLASPAMRRALAARDSGCSFPGCDIPPEWCQVHHVTKWEHGGHTCLHDLAFVCGNHHRQHERQGWECQMIDGIPHWIPPAWIDPGRRPRRNHAHQRAVTCSRQ
ncbi:MAG: HNH endonuclease [Actinomycetia bacterium]|nr:HNH endonuclease [Actinomycetes bacterium]